MSQSHGRIEVKLVQEEKVNGTTTFTVYPEWDTNVSAEFHGKQYHGKYQLKATNVNLVVMIDEKAKRSGFIPWQL